MNLLLDVCIYGLLFLFIWVCSFLFHELMHIFGTGHLDGMINVDGLSMDASPANLWAGGLLSGVVFSLAGVFIWFLGSHGVGYLFVICGVVNMVYGCFEGLFLPQWGNNQEYKLGRYSIYIGVTGMMLLFWMVFLQ